MTATLFLSWLTSSSSSLSLHQNIDDSTYPMPLTARLNMLLFGYGSSRFFSSSESAIFSKDNFGILTLMFWLPRTWFWRPLFVGVSAIILVCCYCCRICICATIWGVIPRRPIRSSIGFPISYSYRNSMGYLTSSLPSVSSKGFISIPYLCSGMF